jgi:succinate dehydrogenase hydrophobic anchor subunit
VTAVLWVLQRASGLFLVLLAGLHVGVQHGLFSLSFRRPVLLGIDWLLLAIVLYHGLNGVRTIAYDYLSGRSAQQAVDRLLWVLGLALFAYGSWGLVLFLR